MGADISDFEPQLGDPSTFNPHANFHPDCPPFRGSIDWSCVVSCESSGGECSICEVKANKAALVIKLPEITKAQILGQNGAFLNKITQSMAIRNIDRATNAWLSEEKEFSTVATNSHNFEIS